MAYRYSQRYSSNPTDDFVLLGEKPFHYREKPGFLSNSLLTETTKNLSQHKYNSGQYTDEPEIIGSLRTISRRLNHVSGDIRNTLLRGNEDGQLNRYSQRNLNESLRNAFNKNPPYSASLQHSQWYTMPVHISSSVNIPLSEEDMLAACYFPVTLGETKSLEMVKDIKPGTPKHLKTSNIHFSTKGKGEIKKEIQHSTVDDAYFLTAVAPNIKTAGITFTSPYAEEITKLRLERLRIEEQQYLELKRQAELEKIRGPKPKWYELKTPEFHREAYKNNELLRNSDKWDELLKYRENLLDASNRLKTALDDYQVTAY